MLRTENLKLKTVFAVAVLVCAFIILSLSMGPAEGAAVSLDTTFSGDGIATHNNAAGGNGTDIGQGMVIDSSGRIVVTGQSVNASGNTDMPIWRYNTDGTLDTTFGGGDGIVTHNNAAGGNWTDWAAAIALDSSGRILVTGASSSPAGTDKVKMSVWRYNTDGTLDTTFNGTGYFSHDGGYGTNAALGTYAIAVDSSGSIVVVGGGSVAYNSDGTIIVWRLNSNGTLDTTFDSDGYANFNTAGGNGAETGLGLAIDGSGRILVSGYSYNASNTSDMIVLRLNSNGALDTSFSGDGIFIQNGAAGGNGHDSGQSIALDSSGRIVVAGYSTNASGNTDMAVWRFNSDGTLDTTFSGDGIFTHSGAAGGNGDDYGRALNFDTSGRIVVSGVSTNTSGNQDMAVWRLDTIGTLDTTFNDTGYFTHNGAAGGNGNDSGYAIALDGSGRIVVAGDSYNASGNQDMALWRLAFASFKLPDTGQTQSYTSTFGEDHDYTINPPSYTDNGNGTITDNVTGLVWQKEDDNTTRNWADAGTYCDGLSLGGQTDWRLPSKKELISLANYGTNTPAIDGTYFPNTNSSQYWSSTAIVNASSNARQVNFNYGSTSVDPKTSSYFVRCVRGNSYPTQSFTDNGNGTVTDNNTGLMWQQQDDDTTRNWEQSLAYCEGLSLGSYSDWRLPNMKELQSIADDTVSNPSIDLTYFPNTNVYYDGAVADYYCSSSTRPNDSTAAFDVRFYDVLSSTSTKTTASYYVRCARGGTRLNPTPPLPPAQSP